MPLPRVYVGFRAPVYGDHRLDALEVASQLLAGGKGSRLYRRLVRDEKIAQDVSFFSLGLIGGASIAAGQAGMSVGPTAQLNDATFTRPLLDTRSSDVTRFSDESSFTFHRDYVWTQSIDVNGDGRVDGIDEQLVSLGHLDVTDVTFPGHSPVAGRVVHRGDVLSTEVCSSQVRVGAVSRARF